MSTIKQLERRILDKKKDLNKVYLNIVDAKKNNNKIVLRKLNQEKDSLSGNLRRFERQLVTLKQESMRKNSTPC